MNAKVSRGDTRLECATRRERKRRRTALRSRPVRRNAGDRGESAWHRRQEQIFVYVEEPASFCELNVAFVAGSEVVNLIGGPPLILRPAGLDRFVRS